MTREPAAPRTPPWPADALTPQADPASCEAAAMQLFRCAATLDSRVATSAALGPDGASLPAVVAAALRELGSGLREYGGEMSRLAAVERALAQEVSDQQAGGPASDGAQGRVSESEESRPDASQEGIELRLHRLRSEAGLAAATIRRCADDVRERLERLVRLEQLEPAERRP